LSASKGGVIAIPLFFCQKMLFERKMDKFSEKWLRNGKDVRYK